MPIEQGITISFVVFEGVEELDLAGPLEVLGAWGRLFPGRRTRTRIEGIAPGPVRGATGLTIAPDGLAGGACDVLVVPGGPGTRPLVGDGSVRDVLRGAADVARIVVGVCTGALLLADAGLLACRRAVTHWNSLELLASLDPTIEVTAGARWVDEGEVMTSAGIAAGIDVALHLVERLGGVRERRSVAHFLEYEGFPEARDESAGENSLG